MKRIWPMIIVFILWGFLVLGFEKGWIDGKVGVPANIILIFAFWSSFWYLVGTK